RRLSTSPTTRTFHRATAATAATDGGRPRRPAVQPSQVRKSKIGVNRFPVKTLPHGPVKWKVPKGRPPFKPRKSSYCHRDSECPRPRRPSEETSWTSVENLLRLLEKAIRFPEKRDQVTAAINTSDETMQQLPLHLASITQVRVPGLSCSSLCAFRAGWEVTPDKDGYISFCAGSGSRKSTRPRGMIFEDALNSSAIRTSGGDAAQSACSTATNDVGAGAADHIQSQRSSPAAATAALNAQDPHGGDTVATYCARFGNYEILSTILLISAGTDFQRD
ncbi:hypothetical protein BV898_17813, partial [Hypsibius exemplaris]